MTELTPTLTETELHRFIKTTADELAVDRTVTEDTRVDLLNGELLDDCPYPVSVETHLDDEYVYDWGWLREDDPANYRFPLQTLQWKANQKFYTAVWEHIEQNIDW